MAERINNTAPGVRPLDYIKITILGFALSALWNSLHSIVLPLRVLDFAGESLKNTYLGLITFAGLILAMLVQPIAGAASDRSRFHWGRRRPFVLFGSVIAILLLPGVGWAQNIAVLFIIYCSVQIFTNTAQGPYQAFIPDIIPQERRGIASGVKSLLEIIGGIALVKLIGTMMSRYSAEESQWLWFSLGTLALIFSAALLVTVFTVKEKPSSPDAEHSFMSILRQSFKMDMRTKPEFGFFLLSRLFIFMAMATLQTFALYFLRDVIRVPNPSSATANLVIAIGIGMITAVYPAGVLADKLGRHPVIVFSALLGAGGVFIIFIAHTMSVVMAGGVIIGLAVGGFTSSNWALATDLVAKSEEARYLGLTNLATAGGSALARLIGPGIDLLNRPYPGLGYQVMLGTCFLYFVAGALLVLKAKPKR